VKTILVAAPKVQDVLEDARVARISPETKAKIGTNVKSKVKVKRSVSMKRANERKCRG
jgi:hypothetical protein